MILAPRARVASRDNVAMIRIETSIKMKRGGSARERGRPRRARGGLSDVVKRVPMTALEESRYEALAVRLKTKFAPLVRALLQKELERVEVLDEKAKK